MSESTAEAGTVPEWDLADRMRKALRVADVGVSEMAEYLDVGRNTVSTWINGRITPSRQTQRLWALRCGVSYEWLATGANATTPPRRDGEGASEVLPRLDSNQQPAVISGGTYNPPYCLPSAA